MESSLCLFIFSDGDLSDAESVEVLAGDDVPAEDLFVQDRCDEAIGPGSSLACEPQNYSGTAVDEDVDAGAKENAKDDADSAEITVSAPNEFTTPSTPMQQSEKDAQKKKWLLDIIVGLALELSIFSLLLDLMFLGLLGFSMAGIGMYRISQACYVLFFSYVMCYLLYDTQTLSSLLQINQFFLCP